jgi:hypothetical protein
LTRCRGDTDKEYTEQELSNTKKPEIFIISGLLMMSRPEGVAFVPADPRPSNTSKAFTAESYGNGRQFDRLKKAK